jgi:hypothetical protein
MLPIAEPAALGSVQPLFLFLLSFVFLDQSRSLERLPGMPKTTHRRKCFILSRDRYLFVPTLGNTADFA